MNRDHRSKAPPLAADRKWLRNNHQIERAIAIEVRRLNPVAALAAPKIVKSSESMGTRSNNPSPVPKRRTTGRRP